MQNEQTPVPAQHPMMVAWTTYSEGDEYANSARWAVQPEHTEGSLWAAFCAGWSASSSSVVQGDAGGVERSPGQVAYEGWAQGLPGCEWSNQTATQKRAWEKAAQAVAALRPQPSGETRDCPHGLHSVGSCSDCSVNRSMDDQPHAPVSRPAGEGEREAVAREIAAEWVAMARKATPPTGCLLRYVPISEGEINALEALLSPAAPDAGRAERLRVLLDNLVIAQGLSKEIRQQATDEARLYLYDLRRDALQPGGER